MHARRLRLLAAALAWAVVMPPAAAQRPSFPPEEFSARRQKLCRSLGDATLLMFAASRPQPGVRFRQDNDFYYLTGNEDLNAALVLGGAGCQASLFLPAQNESQVRVDGPNRLGVEGAAKAWGFEALHPLPYLEEFLARRRKGGRQPLFVRLSERDAVDESRRDAALHLARRQNSPFGGQPSEDAWRVALLRERYHYDRNDRRLQAGELVVMDYGASLGYLTMDVTRTWPVSGRFDELQPRAYRCALEAQKAIIAAMRPGATREQTREVAKAIYQRWGFGDQPAASAGHYVGMAVHDVGENDLPFAAGMAIAVEPIVELRDRQLHVRIEDTVLVTDGEPEVLSAAVPKEVDELLAIVGRRSNH